ncbi:MAG TPA: hypothetical protein VK116_15045 [Planctomycetota bacterium]|nr:hypothetical protein [Planctomycetota bacterium]
MTALHHHRELARATVEKSAGPLLREKQARVFLPDPRRAGARNVDQIANCH